MTCPKCLDHTAYKSPFTNQWDCIGCKCRAAMEHLAKQLDEEKSKAILFWTHNRMGPDLRCMIVRYLEDLRADLWWRGPHLGEDNYQEHDAAIASTLDRVRSILRC